MLSVYYFILRQNRLRVSGWHLAGPSDIQTEIVISNIRPATVAFAQFWLFHNARHRQRQRFWVELMRFSCNP